MRLSPLGDSAITIELGRTVDPILNARVHGLDRAVAAAALPGVRETVPGYVSLLVHYDPLVVGYGELAAALQPIVTRTGRGPLGGRPAHPDARSALVGSPARPPAARAVVEVPVVYGGEDGPDLPEVADRAGLSQDEVVRRHAGGAYTVAMIGFAPGFPYLMGMDPAIACPRLATPRLRVPAGSVAIADGQTGIYPFAMPGGWRLIGRTDLRLFDPSDEPPALLGPGDRVRFMPVDGLSPAAPAPDREPSGGPASPAVRMVDAGFVTTVQDAGRRGYQRYGVPPSGAADRRSLAAGNRLLGNDPGEAALEITAGGVVVEFLASVRLVLSGAALDARLDHGPIPFGAVVTVAAGSRLALGRPDHGLRTYLCIGGGIDVPIVLGSRSTHAPGGFGGLGGRALRDGDLLAVGQRPRGPVLPTEPSGSPTVGDRPIELPFIPGGHWDEVGETARRAILQRPWRVSPPSDRIGLRLDGDEPAGPAGRSATHASEGTVDGAIQLAGDGWPIVLLVDRQTTGGYAMLGAVASVALHRLGQARPGDELVFRPVSVDEAQQAWRSLNADGLGTSGDE